MFSTSCTDWLDVNKNVDSPEWVPPILRLAPTIAGYEGIAYDLRAVAPMVQYWGGTGYADVFGRAHGYYSGSDGGGEDITPGNAPVSLPCVRPHIGLGFTNPQPFKITTSVPYPFPLFPDDHA